MSAVEGHPDGDQGQAGEATTLCDARHHPTTLHCDRRKGHSGRHMEQWVGSWNRDGSDPRWYNGTTASGRDVYREAIEVRS